MGELVRQRNARDLWVSRSHLFAMAAGTLVLAGASFVVGWSLGDHAPAEQAMAAPREDDLVGLLARVEASGRSRGGVDELTFPDSLEGHAPRVPESIAAAPAPEAELPAVSIEAEAGAVVGDPSPIGDWTLELETLGDPIAAAEAKKRLNEAGLFAWVRHERIDGLAVYHVSVGGFATESDAEAAMDATSATLTTAGIAARPKAAKIRD